MIGFLKKLANYLLIGAVAVSLTVVTHELGHFVAYKVFGASDVQLHAFSVSANKETLSAAQVAVAAIVGPLVSYLTVALAWFMLRKKYAAIWLILGLAAPFARLVNAIYVYFRFAGYDPNPNFDEYNFARAIGFDPLWIAIPTTLLFCVIVALFIRIAWKKGGFAEVTLSVAAVAFGLLTWSLLGPFVLP